jgi:hypothetical protein
MLHRIKSLFTQQVCPYCFEKFRLKQAGFRCSSPKCKGRDVDPVLREKWNLREEVGKVLPSPGGWPRSTRCDHQGCGQKTTRRICPHCHMGLPITIGLCPNLIFAVIGAKEAGKSHYIATLVEQLKNRVGPAMDLLVEPLDDYTINRYNKIFYNPLYKQGQTIDFTRAGLVEAQLPLVYSLKQGGTDLRGRRIIRRSTTLVFFDTAGEDLEAEETMSVVNRYIALADGLIILLDPLQLPDVRAQLGMRPGDSPKLNTDTAEILTRTTRLIRAVRDLPPDSILSVPTALAFSKFDAVEKLSPDLQLHQTVDHRGGFDRGDFQAINDEMQSLLSSWDRGGEGLLSQVRQSFRRVGYFGISALGGAPQGTRVSRVLPRRVADPFLWLLYEHGFIKAKGSSNGG